MSEAVTATGILVQRSPLPVAVPAVYTTVAEITDVGPGGMSRNKIPTSTHNEGTESNVLGMLRQADPTLKVNYVADNATHQALLTDIAGNVKASWRVLFPSGVRRTGDGRVQAFAFDAVPTDGKQGASITLTWAGPVTEDVAAP